MQGEANVGRVLARWQSRTLVCQASRVLDPKAAARATALPVPTGRSSAGGSTRIGMPSLSSSVSGAEASPSAQPVLRDLEGTIGAGSASVCSDHMQAISLHSSTALQPRSSSATPTHVAENHNNSGISTSARNDSSRTGCSGKAVQHAVSMRCSSVAPASRALSVRSGQSPTPQQLPSRGSSPRTRMSLPMSMSSSSSEPERLLAAGAPSSGRNFAAEADDRRGSFARSWRSDGGTSFHERTLADACSGTASGSLSGTARAASTAAGRDAGYEGRAAQFSAAHGGTMEDVLSAQRAAADIAIQQQQSSRGHPGMAASNAVDAQVPHTIAASPHLDATGSENLPMVGSRRSVQFSTIVASSATRASGTSRAHSAAIGASQEGSGHSIGAAPASSHLHEMSHSIGPLDEGTIAALQADACSSASPSRGKGRTKRSGSEHASMSASATADANHDVAAYNACSSAHEGTVHVHNDSVMSGLELPSGSGTSANMATPQLDLFQQTTGLAISVGAILIIYGMPPVLDITMIVSPCLSCRSCNVACRFAAYMIFACNTTHDIPNIEGTDPDMPCRH